MNMLSECVPESIVWCGTHQQAFLKFRERFAGTLVPADVITFLFANQKGARIGKFAKQCGFWVGTLSKHAKEGRIEVIRVNPKRVIIPWEQMVKLIIEQYVDKTPEEATARRPNAFRKFIGKVNDPMIPLAVMQFIFSQPNGCSIRQAAEALGYPHKTLQGLGEDGRIEVRPDPKNRSRCLISQDVLISLAVNKYGWATVAEVSEKVVGCRQTFRRYAREGLLGECRQNLSGFWSIRSEWLNNIPKSREIVENIRIKKQLDARLTSNYLQGDEFNTSQIIALVGDLSRGSIHYWIKKGLKAKRGAHGSYAFKRTDLIEFIERVVEGEVRLWSSTREQLKLLRQKIEA